MASASTPDKRRTAYGRCRERPKLGMAHSRVVIRFEIESDSDSRIIAVTAGVDGRPPMEIDAWIARIANAPILSVTGIFRPRHGRAALEGYKAWRIHATEIRIPEPDNGRPGILAARDFARNCEGQGPRADPALRTIILTDLVPTPMRSHHGAYALAFSGKIKGQPVAVLHPVEPFLGSNDLTALSGRLVAAKAAKASGYFRPEVIRSEQVVAWGFVAMSLEPVTTDPVSDEPDKHS